MFEQKLNLLFDFQKFAGSSKLQDLIQDTSARYKTQALTEEELSYVNAAGVPAMMNVKDQGEKNKDDPWNQ